MHKPPKVNIFPIYFQSSGLATSISTKTYRGDYMAEAHVRYPHYHWDKIEIIQLCSTNL